MGSYYLAPGAINLSTKTLKRSYIAASRILGNGAWLLSLPDRIVGNATREDHWCFRRKRLQVRSLRRVAFPAVCFNSLRKK